MLDIENKAVTEVKEAFSNFIIKLDAPKEESLSFEDVNSNFQNEKQRENTRM